MLRIAKDNICLPETTSARYCNEIYNQINLLKQSNDELLDRKQYYSFYLHHLNGFDSLLNCSNQIDEMIRSGNSVYCQNICEKYMEFFLLKSEIGSIYSGKAYLIGEAYCNGQWGFEKNTEKGLAIYKIISNLDNHTKFFTGAVLLLGNNEEFNRSRENSALTAAIFLEYKYKDPKMATYYYKIALGISKILPTTFYRNKIESLSR